MQDWLDAFALEGEAQLDRLLERMGTRGSSLSKSRGQAQRRAADALAQTRAGQAAGKWTRDAAVFFEKIPGLSLPADATKKRWCLDLLVERLAEEESDPFRNLHLAEAQLGGFGESR